jgi:hypothetical protein
MKLEGWAEIDERYCHKKWEETIIISIDRQSKNRKKGNLNIY